MRRHLDSFVGACLQAIPRPFAWKQVPATITRSPRGLFAAVLGILGLGLATPTLTRAQSVRWEPPGGQLGFNQVTEIALVFENCEPDGDPALPKVDGLQFGRPSQSSETSMVNLSVTRRFSLVFPVRPAKRSALTIPAFAVKTDKGAINVKAATFTVGDAAVGNSGLAVNEVANAKITPLKDAFWAGEVFPLTYNLNIVRRYYHSIATNVDWAAAPLVTEDWSKPELNEALVRGERYVVLQQATRAYAKQPGNYTLKPASQMVNLMVGTSGFGLFSQPTVEQRAIESAPLALTIKPLPTPPPDFGGAVGEFSFSSKVVPLAAAVGEPVTWTLELAGTGNWPDITGLPEREVSNDFQVVQPKSKRAMKEGALFEGSLTEDAVLVPTKPGTYRLAPVRFTYFDTRTGTYKTITSDPVTLNITGGSTPVQAPAGSGVPVQFSLGPAANPTPAPPLPEAVAPVPPENLPRDPVAGPASGRIPLQAKNLTLVCLLSAGLCVLLSWLGLAALRSRQRDPQRLRREARARLSRALADLKASATRPASLEGHLRNWQLESARLWEIPHAAPGSPLVQVSVARFSPESAPAWSRLWSEADRTLHGRENALPNDWAARAEAALESVRVPGWPPFSLLAARNLWPFFALALVLLPLAVRADSATEDYKVGKFAAAENEWRQSLAAAPADWTVRHNLGLALAQQDRWAEATAYWTSATLLNVRADATRWDLALGLKRSGLAPAELVELARGEGAHSITRWATPAEWQLALVAAALLLAFALILLLLLGYRHAGAWAKPVAVTTCIVAVLLAAAATFSLHTYGPLAHPDAVMVWKATTLRSIPTDADTTQKTTPLSAGSIALADRTFLGWTKLAFTGGQSGWVRTEDLIRLYR